MKDKLNLRYDLCYYYQLISLSLSPTTNCLSSAHRNHLSEEERAGQRAGQRPGQRTGQATGGRTGQEAGQEGRLTAAGCRTGQRAGQRTGQRTGQEGRLPAAGCPLHVPRSGHCKGFASGKKGSPCITKALSGLPIAP